MEDQGMNITVVGALLIAGVVTLLILLARFLRDESPGDASDSQN